MADSSNPAGPDAVLLEYSDAGSAEAALIEGVLTGGLGDRVELAAEDEAAEEFEESEEKTEPSTRFAFSREASFSSSVRIHEGFFGGGGVGRGRRSAGMKPGGKRVIWIECGLRARGLQGGSGSLAVRDFSVQFEGV